MKQVILNKKTKEIINQKPSGDGVQVLDNNEELANLYTIDDLKQIGIPKVHSSGYQNHINYVEMADGTIEHISHCFYHNTKLDERDRRYNEMSQQEWFGKVIVLERDGINVLMNIETGKVIAESKADSVKPISLEYYEEFHKDWSNWDTLSPSDSKNCICKNGKVLYSAPSWYFYKLIYDGGKFAGISNKEMNLSLGDLNTRYERVVAKEQLVESLKKLESLGVDKGSILDLVSLNVKNDTKTNGDTRVL